MVVTYVFRNVKRLVRVFFSFLNIYYDLCIYFCALFELLDYVTVFWSVASATTSWHCLYLYDSGNYVFILVNSSSQEIRKYDFVFFFIAIN